MSDDSSPPTLGEALLRQVIEAAAEVGCDGKGAGGLKGYLRIIAEEDRKGYMGLLARLMLREAARSPAKTVARIERVIVRAPNEEEQRDAVPVGAEAPI